MPGVKAGLPLDLWYVPPPGEASFAWRRLPDFMLQNFCLYWYEFPADGKTNLAKPRKFPVKFVDFSG